MKGEAVHRTYKINHPYVPIVGQGRYLVFLTRVTEGVYDNACG